MPNTLHVLFFLVNTAQIINFLYAVYLTKNLFNEQLYDLKSLTMNNILSIIWKHTDGFNEKIAQSFSKLWDQRSWIQWKAEWRKE